MHFPFTSTPLIARRHAWVFAWCVFGTLPLVAQEKHVQEPSEPPPAASALFARYREAIGVATNRGSITMTGTTTGPGIPAGSRFTRYVDSAGRYYHEVSQGSTVLSTEGWNGQSAFATTKGVPQRLTPGRAAAVREHGMALLQLHPGPVQANARTIEWSDFNERWHAKVRVVPATGNAWKELYDVGSGLLSLIVRDEGKDADGKKEDKLTSLRAYRAFDGVKVPTEWMEADGKSERRLRVEQVTWNAPLPAALTARRS